MDMTDTRAASADTGPNRIAGLEQPVVWPLTPHRRSLPASTTLTPMEGSHLALFLIDTMSGQVAYWDRDLLCRFANSAYLAWFGRHQTSIIGSRAQDVLGDDIYARDEPHIFAALNGERRQFERRCVKPDGSIAHVLVCYIPDIAHGEVIGFIAHITEITEIKDIEASLKLETEARAQAHALLVTTVARLEEAQRLGQVGSWEWQGETDILTWSPELTRLFGLPPSARPQRHAELQSLFAAESWQRLEAAMRRAFRTGAPFVLELRFPRAGGAQGWLEARGETIRDAAGKATGLRGTLQDTSRRREIEAAFRTSQDALARAGLLAGVGSWEMDFAASSIMWSEQVCRIHGVQPGYVLCLDEAMKFVAPAWRPAMEAAVLDARQRGKGFDLEFEILCFDGTLRWLHSVGVVEFANGIPVRLLGACQDVTERRRLAASVAQQQEVVRVTLNAIGEAVITTDSDGRIGWLNPPAERYTGWSALEAKGRHLEEVFDIADEQTLEKRENPLAACTDQAPPEGRACPALLTSRDGRQYGIDHNAVPIRDESGEIASFVLVFRDVSETRRMAGEMTYRATHDSLTGLINRAEFETRLTRTLQRAKDDGSEHTLLYIDLDQFKVVNDTCGHTVGDHLLRQVARLLGAAVRSTDTLARLGGDEFAIILEGCAGPHAQVIAQKICDRLDDFRFMHDEKRCRIGASIGLVPITEGWAGISAIWQAADTACYAAKEAGRNRVHVWYETDLAMKARQVETQWTSRIERALDENGFVLFAQRITPLHNNATGARAEVLLRMRNKDGSLTPPGVFLPAAERFHLISRVDRWVVARAITWMRDAPSLSMIDSLSVNLSGLSVGDRAFHAWAVKILADAGDEICSRLCLEITETAAITNPADAARFIQAVRTLGVKVALDDFGAGASSFGYLKSLPVDYLKIDGQFIRDLVTDKLDRAAVRCFVDVAKAIGVETVAEFVDDPAVLDHLHDIGVDFAQGFLMHKPEPIEALLT
jgi:diguanylate cyclase (GGDEF)-like protein/PAS domain S-box-containing protein